MLGASINNNLKMKRYMKKILFYFLIMICLSTITGCSNYSEMEIPYKDDHINEPSTNYTYRFVGQSEHFYFQTGKVYYDGKYRALLISNLKVKDNVKSNATFSIDLYFNDKSLFVADRNLTKNAFEDTIIAESGELGERDISGNVIGESDSFLETTKENFKSSIKLEAKYCINNKCKTEPFDIEYLD